MRILKFLGLMALAVVMAAPAIGDSLTDSRRLMLAIAWDLDGEGADDDQVVAGPDALADSTTYTLDGQPDTCRLLDITVVDADSSITAGVLTVTGTDCWGQVLVATFTFAAGGSGVKQLTVDRDSYNASGAYFKTVTSVVTGVLTGEGGGDTLVVGYATDGTPAQYPMYGRQMDSLHYGRTVDPWGTFQVRTLVTTSGAWSTALAAVTATTAPFQNVVVGDLLIFNISGEVVERKVTVRTDADNVTLNDGVDIPAAGVTFSYKKFYVAADPIDMWIPVNGFDAVDFVLDVDANANTGGVISDVTCTFVSATREPAVQVDTDTVASGATGTAVTAVDLRLGGYDACRFGMEFGTNDDADAAPEDINIALHVRR